MADTSKMSRMQVQADEWVSQFVDGYWEPMAMMVRLTEETGELAREINHRFGPKQKKATEDLKEVEGEIGDLLFTLACLANRLEINLDDCFEQSMQKLWGRDNNRWQRKDTAGH